MSGLPRAFAVPGKAPLLYVLRGAGDFIDVGAQELDQVTRLARWYGVALRTKALGYGRYRVRGPEAAS